MAIPTQFSVTETLRTPIPNPNTELDTPIESVPVSAPLFDGAGLINSLSVPSGDAPTIYSAENVVVLDTPSAATDVNPATLDTPSAASTQTAILDTPSMFSANTGTLATPPFALNHARILWDNALFNRQGVSVSGGTGGANTIIPNTYQRWSFTATGSDSILITLSQNYDIDTICIGAHNLSGATIEFLTDIDTSAGGFVSRGTKTITSNQPIMLHLSSAVSVRRLQINITGAVGSSYVGYISAGIALQMQRPFFSGHTPITDGDVTRYYHNETESGEIIGQAIRSQGYQTQADWQNIDDTWYRTYFAPFKQSAKTNPFFIAWNLLQYPDDIGFCRINEDISAPYSGSRTLRSISMKLLGHG